MTVWRLDRASHGATNDDWPSVTMVHSFYRSDAPSGENDTVLRQFRILCETGVNVSLLSVSTDELKSKLGYRFRAAATTAFGVGLSPEAALRDLQPDVVHVHNLFPNVGTTWVNALEAALVVTVHNYRPMCAAATLSRGGEPCGDCLDHGSWSAVRYGCYRDSRFATLPLAWRTRHGVVGDRLLSRADSILAPSPVVRRTYEQAGARRVQTLFQPTDRWPRDRDRVLPRKGGLYFGRLTPEKGLLPLLNAWPHEEPLTVIGSGPLEDQAQIIVRDRVLDVTFLGYVSDDVRDEAISAAEYLVFPSLWREGAPAVYAEALAFGLPVLALAGNAVAELVAEDDTGTVVKQGTLEEWREGIRLIRKGQDRYADTCRSVARERYTTDAWLQGLHSVYSEALTNRRGIEAKR